MPEDFKDVQPKPFKDLSLHEKLELVGITVIPTNLPTNESPIDPYGIDESLDLFDLLATVANKVVNKDTFLDFSLVQKAFATYKGAKDIPAELSHLVESEVVKITECVQTALKFSDPNKAKLEKLVEDLSFGGLFILSAITSYLQKEAKEV